MLCASARPCATCCASAFAAASRASSWTSARPKRPSTSAALSAILWGFEMESRRACISKQTFRTAKYATYAKRCVRPSLRLGKGKVQIGGFQSHATKRKGNHKKTNSLVQIFRRPSSRLCSRSRNLIRRHFCLQRRHSLLGCLVGFCLCDRSLLGLFQLASQNFHFLAL
jgi:hypothetical protein